MQRGLSLPAHLLHLHILPLPLLFPWWFPMLTVAGPGHPVTATVGQDVLLPCHLSPQRDARTLDVRWIREKFSEIVHHYRNGEDLYREQMGAYSGRTELARDGLSAGSLDLRITGLRPSDDGLYVCTVRDADAYDEAIVKLEVAAPGPELGKACPGLSSAPDGLAPSVPAVKVTLDPDTAHPLLVVSPDNKSVRRQTERQQVPDTRERFDCWCCVLGREDFREGRHCWLVEVEAEQIKDSWWAVGVARASVERKGWIDASPKEGIWAVRYYERQLMSLTWPNTRLPLSPIPTRIWVCLDCTQQQVSFINADNGVEIFTFTAASFNGESIRPWFWLVSNSLQLFLRDSTPQTPSPALGGSCSSPDTPASPLLDPAGAEGWDAASRGQAPYSPWALPCP
uniref:Butyrophilin subfamily 1 member A1-like n=1 Tax=Anas zonorhyncha TaxID=75864 RepID=A0A8B9UQ24_9AVES